MNQVLLNQRVIEVNVKRMQDAVKATHTTLGIVVKVHLEAFF